MAIIGKELKTHFAPAERADAKETAEMSAQLRKEPLLSWFDAVPTSVVILNQYRQIVYANEAFQKLSFKQMEDVIGMRPGEALSCINAAREEGDCGCSTYCDVCGKANAILKSFEGKSDQRECRLTRRIDGADVPLDLQVFTKPVELDGRAFTLLFAMDISHELRLRYQSRIFNHSMINTAGGMTALMDMLERNDDPTLLPLLINSSRRILREALYHRDILAAEQNRLQVNAVAFEAEPYFRKLLEEECSNWNIPQTLVNMDIGCKTIRSDKRIVHHIVQNMLANAIEAQEGYTNEIELKCWQDATGTTSITVTNQGEIPKSIQKQMFQRYVSTKSQDRGLGTFVMKMLVEKYLGGGIDFRSEDGETTFIVSFPPGVKGIIPACPSSGN